METEETSDNDNGSSLTASIPSCDHGRSTQTLVTPGANTHHLPMDDSATCKQDKPNQGTHKVINNRLEYFISNIKKKIGKGYSAEVSKRRDFTDDDIDDSSGLIMECSSDHDSEDGEDDNEDGDWVDDDYNDDEDDGNYDVDSDVDDAEMMENNQNYTCESASDPSQEVIKVKICRKSSPKKILKRGDAVGSGVDPQEGKNKKRPRKYALNNGKGSMCEMKYQPYLEVVFFSDEKRSSSQCKKKKRKCKSGVDKKDLDSCIGETSAVEFSHFRTKKFCKVRYRCKACGFMTRSLDTIRLHIRQKEVPKPLACLYCSKRFSKQDYRRKHIRKFHPDEDDATSLRRNSTGITRMLKCTYEGCDYWTTFTNKYNTHISSVHLKLRKHICTWKGCDKRFKTSGALTVHMRIHTDDKPIVCYICGFQCRQKASLNWHMKSKHPLAE